MKIAWIFPVTQKCGISFYSHEYIKTLVEFAEVEIFDIYECLAKVKSSANRLNSFDIIHIQYETSFFLKRNNKKYRELCKLITKPIVISLHEVYDNFPGVFPRSQIKGQGLIRMCKESIYDMRHPYQTVYRQHESNSFFADLLLVHANYHKDILVRQGVTKDKVVVIPHPVKIQNSSSPSSSMHSKILNLSSLGFITQNYNYKLLFSVLENLPIPWRFTWIGGTRRKEDTPLLNMINHEIMAHHWQDTFIITGWVSEENRDALLSQTDIYLALFSARSSSGSLATALGARRLIIATSLPYTRELVENLPVMCITQADSKVVIDAINRLASDNSLQRTYKNEVNKYIAKHSYKKMSEYLMKIYEGIAT